MATALRRKIMYSVKNGILYKDGVAHIAIGQSYYPSYHPQKVPMLEGEGDRLALAKEDMRLMREAGFNVVRYAALGDIEWDGKSDVKYDFPLIDALIKEATENDLASCIRLQGYAMNLRNHENVTMLDRDGNEMPFKWSWFVRACLNHEGILEDNVQGTLAEAKHFGQFDNVVSYQIYNEASYPSSGLYDYHPDTIAAYRKWAVKKGFLTEEQAKDYDPPRRRPFYNESPEDWVNWRMFQTEVMSGFLNKCAEVAKEGFADAETVTCHKPCPFRVSAPIQGEDYFDISEGMDICGITHYSCSFKTDIFQSMLILDGAESAAATFGKNAWLIEYNARTDLDPKEWERETYTAIGAAFKGIFYYEWRADVPLPDSPEPELFGMIYNDGRKTKKYDDAVHMNHLIDSLSPYIAEAHKQRSGIGILYSQHSIAYADALENGDELAVTKLKNSTIFDMRAVYRQLRELGYTPDITRACDLEKNPLGLDMLLIPTKNGLSEEELAQIAEFAKTHPVFFYDRAELGYKIHENCVDLIEKYGFMDPNVKHGVGLPLRSHNLKTTLSILGKKPFAKVTCDYDTIACSTITGTDADGVYYNFCLTNYDDFERSVKDAVLHISPEVAASCKHAKFITNQGEHKLKIGKDGTIRLPEITTGGFVILYNGKFKTI